MGSRDDFICWNAELQNVSSGHSLALYQLDETLQTNTADLEILPYGILCPVLILLQRPLALLCPQNLQETMFAARIGGPTYQGVYNRNTLSRGRSILFFESMTDQRLKRKRDSMERAVLDG